ncbi:MAG TPA: dihydrodipicolinate reductase [Aquabacterium sp.]|nr:dihydrodipicolinate reductase [Aquabacterium sp.]
MQVYIAGAGKLAAELVERLEPKNGFHITRWREGVAQNAVGIVVHAGSGRELQAITAYCARTASVLIELSTGSVLENSKLDFPVVLCPNTNILMLKFMAMLEQAGQMFQGYSVQVTESHQASKSSVPGTAVVMAHSLGLKPSDIQSIRDTAIQLNDLGIPQDHLARHAFHRIEIADGACSISMESRVLGESAYAGGVQQILGAIQNRLLQHRVYSINEFIANGWL